LLGTKGYVVVVVVVVVAHQMELLGDVVQVEGRFSPLGDGVNLGVR
jgi:hypothetical protein